jgi:glucose-1-phosphate thymidylyltransferase
MRAIIPAAGKGTRLRPHSYVIQKSLLEVAGKSILDHLLASLQPAGVSEVAMVINQGDMRIPQYVEEHYKMPFRFYEQKEPKGLAHAIMTAGDELIDEPVLIILGDTLVDTDFSKICTQGHSVLGVMEVEDPRRFGVAVLNDAGRVTLLEEKNPQPRSNLALVGLYYIEKGSLLRSAIEELMTKNILTNGEYQVTDALQIMLDRGEVFTTVTMDGWYDAGTVDALLHTHSHLLKTAPLAQSTADYLVTGDVFIHDSATVEQSVLGPGVSIGQGAIVRDSVISNSIIGRDTVVEASTLERSLIGNGAQVIGERRRLNIADTSYVMTA